MTARLRLEKRSILACLLGAAIMLAPLAAFTQTRIEMRKNRYSEQDDVQLGRQAASEIERQLRILRDQQTTDYVNRLGQRLASAIPGEYQHAPFEYYFKVVDAKEINAFALPGGPMYVNTGMILAAKSEGEVAGVMSHEIAHVALRHGTAQATKAAPYQTLGALGQILGSVVGGTLGGVIGTGSQLGFGAYLLKFSREYETEADILGAQIMARAGYDPHDLAEMFRTIQEQGGGGGPEFLSSHPNPANRYQRIEQEARALRVERGSRASSGEFERIKSRLAGGAASESYASDSERYPNRDSGRDRPELGRGRIGNVEPPSSRFRSYSGSDLFRAQVPSNWRDLSGGNEVWFAPEGGYGQVQGQMIYSHGASIGVVQTQSRNLQRATQEFLAGLSQSNPGLRQSGNLQRATLSGRTANYLTLTNDSQVLGVRQTIEVYTTLLRDGSLFYVLTVAPTSEYSSYRRTFSRIAQSLQINN